MSNQYTPISNSFDKMDEYLRLLDLSPSQSSDYCFSNLWGWGPYFGLEWRFEDDLCWIKQTKNHPEAPVYWAPVGDWKGIKNWKEREEIKSGAHFIRVPKMLCEIWEQELEKIEINETRGHWDYIYLSEELAELPGSKFHQKKNQVNQFMRDFRFEFSPLCEDGVDTVIAMQEEWCRWRDCQESESLQAENLAIERVLAKFGEIPGLTGGIVKVYDKPVAYTMAEKLHDDTMVVHFEKADTQLRGSYQIINYLFAQEVKDQFKYLNREQDLDEPGLRKAKESYNPVKFVEKNEVIIK